ncbi:MAG TPA: HD domain-containing phosphohydrolase [Terriglobales bacterium]|jgi:putative nucleotidyltransferase with HDIG domain|nr:HD domain-containing phosphohydrolase [Terriglobales bacterium]
MRDPANHERILVVDDEESIREVMCAMLGAAGYRCTAAASGSAALQVLDFEEPFELMLSDLMMAEMQGDVLLEHAKLKFPDMPVIMVTAVSDLSVALGAIRNGAYDYLTKPFEREQLLALVRRALEHRRLRKENLEFQMHLESLVAEKTAQLRKTLADLERANEDLKRSHDMMLEALGDALDLKDAETEGHSKRVTAFTIAIARAMELPAEEVETIAHGAFLHDIGKMAIRDSVLRKPGPLNPEEIAEMQKHCELGYNMVRKIPFLKKAAEIVYAHQERWDGTGYPQGLKGEDIPLGARIFAIADTLDAITSDRPYRDRQSYQAAREEIERWSGRQFDPVLVKVFLSMPQSIWDSVRQQIHSQVFRVPQDPQLAGAGRP